ncbi:MAG: DUF1836 domain-containing protein [Oscillospiraceae bacterium]|nr:DUF1836 domain-containing protein [Oscillospiraceae bacterium]
MNDFKDICSALAGHRLPRWEALPDLELYMDQVLSLTERFLGAYPGFDSKGLTASMVNNYVKLGVIPAPVKKRYSRVHLARLLMVCLLKAALPIASIGTLFSAALRDSTEEALYNSFCDAFEATGTAAVEVVDTTAPAPISVLYAALRSQAEQTLALQLLPSLDGEK